MILAAGHLRANLSKLLTYCVLRPTQPPTLHGTGPSIAYGLWGEGLVWQIGVELRLLAANHESNCSFTRAMDDRIVRCDIISPHHFRYCQNASGHKFVSCKKHNRKH